MDQSEQGTLLGIGIVGVGAFVVGKFMIDRLSEARVPGKPEKGKSAGPPEAMQDVVRWVGTIWAAWTLIKQAPEMASEIERLAK